MFTLFKRESRRFLVNEVVSRDDGSYDWLVYQSAGGFERYGSDTEHCGIPAGMAGFIAPITALQPQAPVRLLRQSSRVQQWEQI